MIEIRSLGGFGATPAAQGLIDEAQEWGRVRLTCYIRALQGRALDYLDLKQRAVGMDAVRRREINDHADAVRERINSIVDTLYFVIESFMGGRLGWEPSVASRQCKGVTIPGTSPFSKPQDLEAWPIPVIAGVTVAGLAGFWMWLRQDLQKWRDALDFCDRPGADLSKCSKALDKAQKGMGLTSGLTDVLKSLVMPVGIVAGVGGALYLGVQVFRMTRRRREESV